MWFSIPENKKVMKTSGPPPPKKNAVTLCGSNAPSPGQAAGLFLRRCLLSRRRVCQTFRACCDPSCSHDARFGEPRPPNVAARPPCANRWDSHRRPGRNLRTKGRPLKASHEGGGTLKFPGGRRICPAATFAYRLACRNARLGTVPP